ncbi:MAG: hypothetical protein ACI4EA_04565 [Candidatus Ornithomonoglobus sp.]
MPGAIEFLEHYSLLKKRYDFLSGRKDVPLSAVMLVKHEMDEVTQFIDRIDNELYGFILTLKYIELKKTDQIARVINYSQRQTERFIAAAKAEAVNLYAETYGD